MMPHPAMVLARYLVLVSYYNWKYICVNFVSRKTRNKMRTCHLISLRLTLPSCILTRWAHATCVVCCNRLQGRCQTYITCVTSYIISVTRLLICHWYRIPVAHKHAIFRWQTISCWVREVGGRFGMRSPSAPSG